MYSISEYIVDTCDTFAVEIQHLPRGDRNEFVQKYQCVFARMVQNPRISHFVYAAYHVRTYCIAHFSRYTQGE